MVQKKKYKNQKFTLKLCLLMASSSYKDWLQAWILIRDKVHKGIKTFDDFDSYFNINKYGYYINNMLYELDMALHNEGLDDLRFMAQRAELARWVYTHFNGESELNCAHFRAYEADSLWVLGKIELAESLIKESIQLYPRASVGYVIWADFYWSSDWSYQHGVDYEKAESIYRQALSIKGLDDYVPLKDNYKSMLHEKEHPEVRERIKKYRLKRIKKRTSS